MQKIYHHNKPVYFIQSPEQVTLLALKGERTVQIETLSETSINFLLERLMNPEIDAGLVIQCDFAAFKTMIGQRFVTVKAAGGAVIAGEEMLLIFRRGKWDLPKGKLDAGESLEDCAAREIEEETGVGQLQLVSPLTITYHTYIEKGKNILKESYWYLFTAQKPQVMIPQTEEDIEECLWVSLTSLELYKPLMHASLVDVVEKAQNAVKGLDKLSK